MGGKIIGTGIMALVQMGNLAFADYDGFVHNALIVLPPELAFSISMNHILFLLINFALGLVTYLGLFATAGSIFDNPQDAQQECGR
jgi:ABC-type Na+ efflux pump permease subunit